MASFFNSWIFKHRLVRSHFLTTAAAASKRAVLYVRPLYAYAIENTGTSAVTLNEPFYGETTSVSASGTVYIFPQPGVFQIEIYSASGTISVVAHRVSPMGDIDHLPEEEIPIGQFPLSDPNAIESNAKAKFERPNLPILTETKFYRRIDGRWRTDSAFPTLTPFRNPTYMTTDMPPVEVTLTGYYMLATGPGLTNVYLRITYVSADGNDLNDGQTPNTAKRTLRGTTLSNGLIGDNVPRYIILESGRYMEFEEGWFEQPLGAHKMITSSIAGVTAFLTNRLRNLDGTLPAWTAPVGTVYEWPAANLRATDPSCIVDFSLVDTDNRPTIAFIGPQTATYQPNAYVDSGSLFYDRGSTASFDPTKVFVLAGGTPHKHSNPNYRLWVRDVEMWGGAPVFNGSNANPTVAAIRQFFMDSAIRFGGQVPVNQDLVKLEQIGLTTFLRCELTDSASDGSDSRTGRLVLEEASAFKFCGTNAGSGKSKNQASTAHEGALVLSIDSEYAFTGGACVADAQVGVASLPTYRMVLGCFLHSSRGEGGGRRYGLALAEPPTYDPNDTSTAWVVDPSWVGRFGEGVAQTTAKVILYKPTTIWSVDLFESWESSLDVASKNFAIPSLTFRSRKEGLIGSKTS
jgi:hypothetical protein